MYGISVTSKDPIGIVWLLQTLFSRPADAWTWKKNLSCGVYN